MKYLFRSRVFVIQYELLYSLCLLIIYGIPREISLNMLVRKGNFEFILHYMEDKNRTFGNNIVSQTTDDSRGILVDNYGYCMYRNSHNKGTLDHYLESSENYDTLTQSDIVRTQYMKLPYPAVSHQQLAKEKAYYYTHQKNPYTIVPSLTFEALNHYLYKGRNTFR